MLFLAQSDTTVGFLSQNAEHINSAKGREGKKVLLEVDCLATLRNFTRIPEIHKNFVRKAKKTTFIYPNALALRVIKDEFHLRFLHFYKWLYSSSANPTASCFSLDFALQKADIIIEDKRGFFQNSPSKIYKLTRTQAKRIR